MKPRRPLLALLGLGRQAEADRPLLRQRLAELRGGSPEGEDGAGTRNPMLARGPFPLPNGATLVHDIAYGGDPAQRLDVYRPADAAGAPIVLMVHGGGWSRGDKALHRSVRNKVLHWVGRLGYVLVSINYRMLPAAAPLAQADDLAMALAFVQAHAASWGAYADRLVLMGHSSGGHLASLLSVDPSIAEAAGARPWRGTVTIDSAAFDVGEIMRARHFGFYDEVFGTDEEDWRAMSPTHRLREPLTVPMLAVYSSQRCDSSHQAEAFAARAKLLGGSEVRLLPVDLSHGDINDLLGAPGDYTEHTAAFIRSLGLP